MFFWVWVGSVRHLDEKTTPVTTAEPICGLVEVRGCLLSVCGRQKHHKVASQALFLLLSLLKAGPRKYQN